MDAYDQKKDNIVFNEQTMLILEKTQQRLKEIGVHVVVSPTSLPTGMVVSLHAAMTEDAAIAGHVIADYGGSKAHVDPQRLHDDVAALKAEWQQWADNPPPGDA